MAGQVLCEDKSRDMASSSSADGGDQLICFPDNPTIQPHLVVNHQIHQGGFVSDPEMFNLTTAIDMIGFSKHHNHNHNNNNSVMWKSLFGKQHVAGHDGAGASSNSKTINDSNSTISFYHHHEYNNNSNKAAGDFTSGINSQISSENHIIVGADSSSSAAASAWQQDDNNNRLLLVDDDSSLRCVFPNCSDDRQIRPTHQGLSLSLNSTNPPTIALQSFEHRPQTDHNHHHHNQMLQANIYQGHFLIKNSKFLAPAQDLLNEFCGLGTKQNEEMVKQRKPPIPNKQSWEEDNNGSGNSSNNKQHPLSSLEFVELQKRKTKLLAMLEEVDRRYKHYCNQMKAVVSSFEAVAGTGAATVYSALALKAMSRHFRCLKDGIMDQIEATRKGMGEKEPIAPGTTRGETPRLRIIDQVLRQQRAFQQMSMMETHPWRPQRGLPERSVSFLRAWLFEHFLHPYPSDVDKHILARQTGLSRSQVSNWFINARVRLWKPMVEEMYLEEAKEHDENNTTAISSEGLGNNQDDIVHHQNPSPPNSTRPSSHHEDQKPTQPRLLRIDSECVSSIINNNNPDHNKDNHMNQQCLGRVTDTFGSVEIDFSSYGYGTSNHDQNGFNSGGGAVSLTLGLQQHGGGGGGGVSLAAFPPNTHHHHQGGSMFYSSSSSREQIEDQCDDQPIIQYSLLEGEGQTMPYRNLMGTQLLHDLPG